MFNRIIKKQYKKTYRFYEKELSNFKTVMKDTNNSLVIANRYNYNCMSYALGVFNNWLVIDAFDISVMEDEDDCHIDYSYMNDVFYDCCVELEERFAVRRLSGPNAVLAENERMIAFRIGADDFHFARKNSDGTWTHKPGANYIREMTEGELFSDCWSDHKDYPYISEIAFFAVAIQEVIMVKKPNKYTRLIRYMVETIVNDKYQKPYIGGEWKEFFETLEKALQSVEEDI